MSAFSQRLKDWRAERCFTQATAAAKLGVAMTTVSKWEAGSLVPCATNVRRIAKVLRVRMETIRDEASDAALARAGE